MQTLETETHGRPSLSCSYSNCRLAREIALTRSSAIAEEPRVTVTDRQSGHYHT